MYRIDRIVQNPVIFPDFILYILSIDVTRISDDSLTLFIFQKRGIHLTQGPTISCVSNFKKRFTTRFARVRMRRLVSSKRGIIPKYNAVVQLQ
jgi:hypothetical protein